MALGLNLPSGCVEACPGCPHRALSAQESLFQKRAFVEAQLAAWRGQISEIRSVHEARRWNYRDRAVLSVERVSGAVEGPLGRTDCVRLRVGLRGRKQDPRNWRERPPVISIPDCPVHTERVRGVIRLLEGLRGEVVLLPLVYVVVSGALVTLVFKARKGDIPAPALAALGELAWGDLAVEGVLADFHPSAGDRVLSSGPRALLWGRAAAAAGDIAYGPSAFLQLLPELHQDSVRAALDFLTAGAPRCALDFYCGIGVSLRAWRARGVPALGVELSGEAVSLARQNAASLDISVLQGKCSERLPQVREFLVERAGHITNPGGAAAYLNPPRMGLAREVVDFLRKESRISRVAILSCSPATLKRDLGLLSGTEGGPFQVVQLLPYDFFPQARNVEVLALLERRDDWVGGGQVHE